jgi:hypothetical protein
MGMGCYSHPNVIWVCSCLECEPQATGILTQFHDCFPVDLTWRFQLEHFPFRWGKTLSWLVVLPSGNLLHSYWKWWFIVDLPIENMVIFHSFLYVYPRVPPFMIWDDPFKWRWPLSRAHHQSPSIPRRLLHRAGRHSWHPEASKQAMQGGCEILFQLGTGQDDDYPLEIKNG